MFLDLGIFPQVVGWWVDFCTIDLLGASWESRNAFAMDNPITAVLIVCFTLPFIQLLTTSL